MAKATIMNRITVSQKVLSNNKQDFTFTKLNFCTVIDISNTKKSFIKQSFSVE